MVNAVLDGLARRLRENEFLKPATD